MKVGAGAGAVGAAAVGAAAVPGLAGVPQHPP